MFKFNMYEVVRIACGGYSFDGCMGVVMARWGCSSHSYAVLPLHPDALEAMHTCKIPARDFDSSEPPVTYHCVEHELEKLRPYVAQDIPLFDEPEEVAPEEEPEPEDASSPVVNDPSELRHLKEGLEVIRALAVLGASEGDYLSCRRVSCNSCPFELPEHGCGVYRIGKVIDACIDYKNDRP